MTVTKYSLFEEAVPIKRQLQIEGAVITPNDPVDPLPGLRSSPRGIGNGDVL